MISAVFCPEEEIPKFKDGTVAGTTNYLDLKAASPDYWNMYKKRVTYTCPVGYVIEKPGNVYNEQPDPIPEELETFEVECAADAVWTPRPKDGGNYMPYCIRKYLDMFNHFSKDHFFVSHKLHRATIPCGSE